MGLMETRVIQINNDPVAINATNEAWGQWGWSVMNIQVTHSQDSRVYQDWLQYGTNSMTTETTTINYATITYQRDKEMKNYARIAALQQEYETIESRVKQALAGKYQKLAELEAEVPKMPSMLTQAIIGIILACFWIFPAIIYRIHINRKQKRLEDPNGEPAKKRAEYERFLEQVQMEENRMIREEAERIERERAALFSA